MAMLKSSLLPWSARIRHARIHGRCRVGNRDYVGYCVNGSANYRDDAHYPFPSVRFKENTEDVCALRRKECGDWRSLCCEEKKALYRASFCQTFAEFQHPTGLWKVVIGGIFFTTSFAFWFISFYHNYVQEPVPESYGLEPRMAQLRRMLELHVQPIEGLSSKWDYDNDRWKSCTNHVSLAPSWKLPQIGSKMNV
ncbi:cytochrome c oxidase subunit 4 isoform 1, mitochondrial-like [Choristoneura fumiferana]|uniref:cytochrome c oxidase subunit 4 isoform 1, mitochondrial-like n=1 Tax=Choristoneura fumiferana TaxID=7141 RepID=UPI003D1580FE